MSSSTRRKRHRPEQIVARLREAEALLASGQPIAAVCQKLSVSEQTYDERDWVGQVSALAAHRK
jgi:hypothetical protein